MNTTYEIQIKVVNAIRRAAEKFKHYQNFTKRCLPFIEVELPEYTIDLHIERSPLGHLSHKIRVWGHDLSFSDRIEARFIDKLEDGSGTWYDALQEELKRLDMTDQLERMEHEKSIYPELKLLDQMSKELMMKLKMIRTQANKLVGDLPIPPTAIKSGMREKEFFWNKPSSVLTEKFPNVFNKLELE